MISLSNGKSLSIIRSIITVEIDSLNIDSNKFDQISKEAKKRDIYFEEFLQHSDLGREIINFVIVTLPQGITVNAAWDALKYIFLKLTILFHANGKDTTIRIKNENKEVNIDNFQMLDKDIQNKIIDKLF